MEHEIAVEKLSEYRDGALSLVERDAVARHLSVCAECSSIVADDARLARAFFRRPAPPTAFETEGFAARVMSRLPAADPLSWLTARWLVPAFGAALAVLALSFVGERSTLTVDSAASLIVDSGRSAPAATAATPADEILGLGEEK